MDEANPASTPMATSAVLCSEDDHLLCEDEHSLYRSMVSSLMYAATCTRPDISFAVGELGRYSHKPTKAHMRAAKRVLRYLKGTRDLQLCYTSVETLEITGFADADYASDVDQRKSVTGYIFACNGAPIAWKSKRQATTATSTSEAEYVALSDSGKMAITLSNVLGELLGAIPSPVNIYEDNRAASLMAKGESSMKRSKHIDVRFHFIKELVNLGKITITDIATKDQLADALTKALPRDKYQYFVRRIMRNSVEDDRLPLSLP